MGTAEFIKGKFLGQPLYVSCGETAETITYDQAWAANKEFLYGIVEDVESGILTLAIPNCGIIYINCENIVCFWEPGLDYHQAVRTSLTRRVIGAKRKDG